MSREYDLLAKMVKADRDRYERERYNEWRKEQLEIRRRNRAFEETDPGFNDCDKKGGKK